MRILIFFHLLFFCYPFCSLASEDDGLWTFTLSETTPVYKSGTQGGDVHFVADVCTGIASYTRGDSFNLTSYKKTMYLYKHLLPTFPNLVAAYAYGEREAVTDITYTKIGCECPDGSEWNPTTGECESSCGDKQALKEYECGGSGQLASWDEDTCTGLCLCEESPDDPNTHTWKQMIAFCGGENQVDYWTSETCLGQCKGCDDEFQAKEASCAALGLLIDRDSPDKENCVYECVEPDPCTDEFEEKESSCGFWGVNKTTYNWETCEGECNEKEECQDDYDEFVASCGIAGVYKWDSDSCTGKCKDCEWASDDCQKDCPGTGGISECSQFKSGGVITGIEYGSCECLAPDEELGSIDEEMFPGSQGGVVVNNPDGSKTETLDNGTVLTYSADGKTVTATDSQGRTIKYTEDTVNITETYVSSDGAGSVKTITLEAQPDGSVIETTTISIDRNANNPELGEDLIEISSETRVVPPDEVSNLPNGNDIITTVTDITGAEIPSVVPSDETGGVNIAFGTFAGDSVEYADSYETDSSSIDWSPITSLGSRISDKLPAQFAHNLVTAFGPESNTAPVLYFNLPDVVVMGNTVSQPINELDLSPFNIVAQAMRWILGLIVWVMTFKWIYSIILGA